MCINNVGEHGGFSATRFKNVRFPCTNSSQKPSPAIISFNVKSLISRTYCGTSMASANYRRWLTNRNLEKTNKASFFLQRVHCINISSLRKWISAVTSNSEKLYCFMHLISICLGPTRSLFMLIFLRCQQC